MRTRVVESGRLCRVSASITHISHNVSQIGIASSRLLWAVVAVTSVGSGVRGAPNGAPNFVR